MSVANAGDPPADARRDRDDAQVDAVIAWVDGSDPAHRERLARTLAALGIQRPATATPTRFDDAGEIDYCIASIVRHAPWVRRIHVVTDAQVPPVLRRIAGTPLAAKVRLVDHREIFAGFEQCLPTFNSRAICSMLWRIPGLAERYIYFNDDMSLLRPVQAEDFFRDGKVVARGSWRRQSHAGLGGRAAAAWKRRFAGGAQRDTERAAQELSARMAGFEREYYRIRHVPYPFRRSTLEAYFAGHPDALARDLAHPFRRPGQFRAECLAAHLEIASGHAVQDNSLRVVQLKPREQAAWRLRGKLAGADRDPATAFACVQSIDEASAPMRAAIFAWLDRRIGRPGEILSG